MAPPKKRKEVAVSESTSTESSTIMQVAQDFWRGYSGSTLKRIKILDGFSLLCMLLLAIQVAYRILVGTFPKNAFLAGVFCPLGGIILTGSLN